jgi:hypothetical protein
MRPDVLAPAVPIAPQLADPWGWLSFAAVVASLGAAWWAARRRPGMLLASVLLVGLAILAAAVAVRWDTGNWLAYNTLLVGHGLIAAVALTIAQAAAGGLLSVREAPETIWWTVGGLAYLGAVVMPLLAWIYQRRRYLYLAAPLVAIAALVALDQGNWIGSDREFALWSIVLLALPAPLWLLIELVGIRTRTFRPAFAAPPVHRLVARLGVAVLVLLVGSALADDWFTGRRAGGRARVPVGCPRPRLGGPALRAGAGGLRRAPRRL